MAKTNARGARTLPRTAKALADFLGEQVRRSGSFPQASAERAAIENLLREVIRKAPWRAIDQFVARRHNASVAGGVALIAEMLKGQPAAGFPAKDLAVQIASACPDLHPLYRAHPSRHRRAAAVLPRRVEEVLRSAIFGRVLFGRYAGEPRGPKAAAEMLVAKVTEVALSTVREARRDLGGLRR